MSIEIVVKEQRSKYVYNVATLRKYGNRYKVTWQKSQINKGVNIEKRERGTNEEKLDCNLRRAKNKIREYALCNDWDYFCTLTLDKMKMDRYDIKKYIMKLGQMIRDIRKKTGANIQYLLIPEKHKDGAWHMHGLLKGIPKEMLVRSPVSNRKRVVYNWIDYADKFGFTDLEPVESIEKVSSYIMKYVTKDMSRSIKELNAKTYYNSRGLNTSENIETGTVSAKYNPQYTKTINDEPVYSEMWLPPNITYAEAKNYLEDNTWSELLQDSDLTCDIPFEWI